jgi:hypothetical protein
MRKNKDILLVAIPLMAGFAIYFSCRPKSLLYYQLIPFRKLIGLDYIHGLLVAGCVEFSRNRQLAEIIIFSVPAAMYAFSLSYYLKKRYLTKVYGSLSGFQRIIANLALVMLVAYLPEYLQQIRALPGRFDLIDIITASLAASLALAL